ncbi:MAG: hypothetical protein ACOX8K_05785 [Lachnospiraceae bacterium]|jgi:hypothetical protein
MKLPDGLDIGNKWDLVFHRLQIAEEDLVSANLLWESGQYRGLITERIILFTTP